MELGSFANLDIVLLGLAAGFVIYRLASVLGRRTGHERERFNPYLGGGKAKPETERPSGPLTAGDDGRLARPAPPPSARASEDSFTDIAPKGSPLSKALTEIQLADRHFDPKTFLGGARVAYEMIVTAFARGNKKELETLLGADVKSEFFSAIDGRTSRGETNELSFVGIRSAEITEAALNGKVAEVTVRFHCEVISCTKNSDGAVIEGDPTSVIELRDLWTFARDTRSSDPNWQLVSAHPA